MANTTKQAKTHWGKEGRPFWKIRVFNHPNMPKQVVTHPGGVRHEFRRNRDTIVPDAVLEALKQTVTPLGDHHPEGGPDNWYLEVKAVNNSHVEGEQYQDTISLYPMQIYGQATEDEYLAQFSRKKRKEEESFVEAE